MMIHLVVLLTSRGFIFKEQREETTTTLLPKGLQRIPSIPLYQLIYGSESDCCDYYKTIRKDENYNIRKAFIRGIRTFIKERYGRLRTCKLLILLPEDAIATDQHLIREFFRSCGFRYLSLQRVSKMIHIQDSRYIYISASERLLSVELIEDGQSLGMEYYPVNLLNQSLLERAILKCQSRTKHVPVYLGDMEGKLCKFKTLGTVISLEELWERIGY